MSDPVALGLAIKLNPRYLGLTIMSYQVREAWFAVMSSPSLLSLVCCHVKHFGFGIHVRPKSVMSGSNSLAWGKKESQRNVSRKNKKLKVKLLL